MTVGGNNDELSSAIGLDRATQNCDSRMQDHHAELYQSAKRELRRMARSGTIDTVALVNEAYLRARKGQVRWQSQEHFLASMTTIMRHVLIDYARERGAERRGGAWLRVTTGAIQGIESTTSFTDLIAVDEAMTSLGKMSPRLEKLVELKVFGGLTVDEMASALNISKSTVSRDLRTASAYLRNTISE